MNPGEWLVKFKLVQIRQIKVQAIDEIDAEVKAAQMLTPEEVDEAEEVKVASGRYEDGRKYTSSEWNYPLHRE